MRLKKRNSICVLFSLFFLYCTLPPFTPGVLPAGVVMDCVVDGSNEPHILIDSTYLNEYYLMTFWLVEGDRCYQENDITLIPIPDPLYHDTILQLMLEYWQVELQIYDPALAFPDSVGIKWQEGYLFGTN